MDQFSTSIPDVVLLSGDLPALGKILYLALLQKSKGSGGVCTLTIQQLCKLTHLSRDTVRKNLELLTQAGLITPLGNSRYRVKDESAAAWVSLRAQVVLRLEAATYRGEQLMRELLSACVDSERFQDGARLGFMTNPLTGQILEFDRLYLDGVAFEFQGAQHYAPTSKYPNSEEARKRRALDLIKRGLCDENGIKLVTVNREDLSVEGILKKIGNLLPLRPGIEGNPVVKYLEQECKAYRNSMAERDQRKREERAKQRQQNEEGQGKA